MRPDPEHIKRIAEAITRWQHSNLPFSLRVSAHASQWRPGLKDEPKRTKPFLTAADLVLLREMKISL